MQQQYKKSVSEQLNGATIIGNEQYVIIEDFITTQEGLDMHKWD